MRCTPAEYVLTHVKADGPVSLESIQAWCDEQMPVTMDITGIVADLKARGRISEYEIPGTYW